jgi:hypothetical protein
MREEKKEKEMKIKKEAEEMNETTEQICIIFEILTAVKMSIFVFWVLTPCGLVGRYHRFGGTHFNPEDGGSVFIRNDGICVQVHTVLQLRRPTSATKLVGFLYSLHTSNIHETSPWKHITSRRLEYESRLENFKLYLWGR